MGLGHQARQRRREVYVEHMIRHKNDEWLYEEELRQLFQLAGLKRRQLKDGRVGYFLAIPADIVASVFLGLRCSADDEAELRSALSNPHFSHVPKPKRAQLHESKFALEFR
jgi:hypothetical protein